MFLFLSLSQIVCFLLIQCANAKDLSRIINGTYASIEELRYTVSIRKRETDIDFGEGHICGGALIKRDVVLSAAHCFANFNLQDGSYFKPNEFYVVMGNLNLYKKDSNTVIRDIVKILTYRQKYSFGMNLDDISLLYLKEPVPIDHPIIQTIELHRGKMPVGTMCNVHGWGEAENGQYPENLKTLKVPLSEILGCAKAFDIDDADLTKGMLCAGYLGVGQRDTCRGDSGGPLVCKNVLTGIVSFGPEICASPLAIAVYTNVSFYSSWIDKNLENTSQRFEDHYGLIIFLIGSLTLRTYELLFI